MKRFLALLFVLLIPCCALADTLTALPTPDADMKPVSFSPDGRIGLYTTGSGLVLLHEDGSTQPLVINENRSAADTYGNLAKVVSRGAQGIGNEGLVWSPDSRYAAIVNNARVVQMAQFIYDPIIIDTQTGEVFLLATYANAINKDNSGVMLTCTFSADSRYLYAVILGSLTDARFCLVQYDLATYEASVLHSWDEQTYWPHLAQLSDGSFLLLVDDSQLNDFAGLIHITRTENGYAHTVSEFTQRILFFRPQVMQYNAHSKHALLLSNANQGSNYYSNMLYLQPGQDTLIPNEYYWAISSLDDSHVASLVKNQLQSPSEVMILAMCLSPDGERALLVCFENGSYALRMLTLADGSLTPVSGVNSDTLQSFYKPGGPYIAWSGDIILIGASPADATAFKLE